jgi:DNA topoisomerase-1
VREIRERQVARVVRQLLKRTPHGRELFKYENGQRELVDVRRRHINEYIKEVMGERFSAKDFRTWAGTLICASALARAGAEVVAGKSARRRKIVAAIKETAEQLGNTPAVCRSSYIAPAVLDHFERGRVIERTFGAVEELVEHRHGVLHPSEKAVLGILKRSGASKGSRDR